MDDEFEQLLRNAIAEEMLCPLDAKFLGPKKWVYCYRPPGQCGYPARTFLDSLPMARQGAYAVSFQKHCLGFQLRGEKWHPLDGHEGLYEYKDIESKSRIIHTTDKWQWHVLLFGFGRKKEKKIDPGQILQAEAMRDEYRQRRAAIEARLQQQTLKRKR